MTAQEFLQLVSWYKPFTPERVQSFLKALQVVKGHYKRLAASGR